MQIETEPRHPVYVARQPILDGANVVFGYELLYRATAHATTCTVPGDVAGASVFTNAVLTMGLDVLTNGRPAFLKMTRDLLLGEAPALLPAATTVLEVGPDITLDAEVIGACKRLQSQGYTLAVDNYDPALDIGALLPFVKFVKVDTRAVPAAERGALARRLVHRAKLVATKVETADTFDDTKREGFGLFQGYFFCRPTTIKGGTPPGRRLTYLRLLAAINQPNVTLAELEELVKQDVSLCYRVLRCINSAAFGLQMEIHSIRQALVLLGVAQVRKWASVWSLASAQQGSTAEILPVAIIRARCCELLGERMPNARPDSGLFLLGMCSLLDAMLGRPMSSAVAELPLAADIRQALLGHQNTQRAVLDAVIAYERGDFTLAFEGAAKLGIPSEFLSDAYSDALRYARELSRDVLAA